MSLTVLGSVGLLLLAEPARPTTLAATLDVERPKAAADCPDAIALRGAVERIVGSSLATSAEASRQVRVEVDFARTPMGYQAKMRLYGAREGARSLADPGPNCSALGKAVAIALALLLEAGDDGVRAQLPAPVVADPTEPWRVSGHAALRGGLAWGDVARPSGLLGLELGLGFGQRTSLWLGGQQVFARTTPLGPGTVTTSLRAAHLALCQVVNPLPSWVTVAGCLVAFGGALRGQGEGYATNETATRAWWAAGAALRAQVPVVGRWHVVLAAEVAAPWHDDTFSVAEVGRVAGSGRWLCHLLLGVGTKLW